MNKAEEFYLTLLGQSSSHSNHVLYYYSVELIKDNQGDYKEAVRYYEQALSINEQILSPTDLRLATSYNNMDGTYDDMKEYPNIANSYFQKALDIFERSLPLNHPDIQNTLN